VDEQRLLEWRNDPEVRAQSFSAEEVDRQAHSDWFAGRLADPATLILIVEDDDGPVGQVRLDDAGEGVAEVHVALAPSARGRGYGREALALAAREARAELGAHTVLAKVKAGNERSLRTFRAAGFEPAWEADGVVELRRSTPAG
jgi:RimJ/RimL family protein N-acetyltransferase